MEFKKNQSIYLQIADLICEQIMTSHIAEGEKVSSVREMAATIEVNPNTVMRTYSYLQDNNIIYNKRGIGFFVSEGASKKIKDMQKQEFLNQELPEVFRKMDLLDLKLEEVSALYNQHKKDKNENI